MSKIKSAICLTLISVLIVGICFMCFVSFPYAGDIKMFNTIFTMQEKDGNLGSALPDGYQTLDGTARNYIGGGYSAVYYPDGVISAREYADNLAGLREAAEGKAEGSDEQKAYQDYLDQYVPYPDEDGAIYLEREKVCGSKEGTEVSDEFKADFQAAKAILRARLDRMHIEGVSLEVRDDYTLKVGIPDYTGSQASLLGLFSYMGEFGMGYGSDADSATRLTPAEGETMADYVKGASSRVNGSTAYVVLKFTGKGKNTISEWTASAADSATTLFFYVGDNAVISLSVSEAINQNTLYISGSYTADTARIVALTIDTALNEAHTGLSLTVGDVVRERAAMGDLAFTLLLVAAAALFVGMAAFFFVRYHGLGAVNLYTSLIWLLVMILAVWGIPFLHLGVETFAAVMLSLALLGISEVIVFERVRKEFAMGKTIVSSVKAGYKACFWQIFDLHIALAILAFVTYFIALTELSVFAFTLGLGVVLSGLCTLAVGRFHWAALMSFASNKGKFCNFKREETEDD